MFCQNLAKETVGVLKIPDCHQTTRDGDLLVLSGCGISGQRAQHLLRLNHFPQPAQNRGLFQKQRRIGRHQGERRRDMGQGRLKVTRCHTGVYAPDQGRLKRGRCRQHRIIKRNRLSVCAKAAQGRDDPHTHRVVGLIQPVRCHKKITRRDQMRFQRGVAVCGFAIGHGSRA